MGCFSSQQKAVDPPFPKLGVKINVFYDFIEKCGGYDAIKDLSTTDMRYRFLKKPILPVNTSYCDYLNSINHPDVGVATVFISHAWKYKFLDVLNALGKVQLNALHNTSTLNMITAENHFRDEKDIIVWFDLFSNDQTFTHTLSFQWWTGIFKTAIEDLNRTVMVLSPWDNPEPLRRYFIN